MALNSMLVPPSQSPAKLCESLTIRNQTDAPIMSATTTTPPKPSLKSLLKQGHQLNGLILFTANPTFAEIAILAGYDFIVVDLEHGPGNYSDALHCLRAIEARGSYCVVRVPEVTAAAAKKALDLGVQGIMFPKIETADDAAKAVALCRYPPKGTRGCAYSLVRDSDYGFNEGYLEEYHEKLLIMCQVETLKGVDNIHGIMAVDGMDCVTTGPRDLSASLSLLHDPGHDKVREVMSKLERSVLESNPEKDGAYLAGIATPRDNAVELKKRGYNIVLGASDISTFTKTVIEDVKAFKA